MKDKGINATLVNLSANSVLFIIKFFAGLLTGSIAVISDSMNSFTDVVASIAVFYSVKVSLKKADKTHPFGHHRAQPIAGLIVAIFTGIVGFEIIREAILGIFSPSEISFGIIAVIVLIISIIVKALMHWLFWSESVRLKSPAIKAISIDSRNDVLMSSIALLGVFMSSYQSLFDDIAAFFIGIYIIYSGYKIGRENIDYLMGAAPDPVLLEKIRCRALAVRGVKGIEDERAHFVGNFVNVSLSVLIDKNASTKHSHDIATKVKNNLESLNEVDYAFIHVEPALSKCLKRGLPVDKKR